IWVTQRGCGTSFALEALQSGVVAGQFFGQELQSHTTSQPKIFCLIHHAHAAAAEDPEHTVMRHLLAYQMTVSLSTLLVVIRRLVCFFKRQFYPLHQGLPAIAPAGQGFDVPAV